MPRPLLNESSKAAEPNHGSLVRLLAIGQLSLVIATFRLWTPQSRFPQVPLISFAGRVPEFVEWGLLIGLLASLGMMLFVVAPRLRRVASLVMGLSTLSLVCIDQHRLQPWAWQFVVLSLILAAADDPTSRLCWRWFVISIYAWSAWSKMDHGFIEGHGRFLIDGLCKAIGLVNPVDAWPKSISGILTAAIPVYELAIALGLCWQRTRRMAVVGAAIMHLGLLLSLGPFGHGHQPGVLIWNLFFLVQNWLLFYRAGIDSLLVSTTATNPRVRLGNAFARVVLMAVIAWPSLESAGFCDHWLAWAVYAARPERVTIYVHPDEVSKLPETLKQYLGSPRPLDEWLPLRIDRWSLDTVQAPLYPQDRFQIGVATSLARNCDLTQMRVMIESPAHQWTGQRTIHRYFGLESLNRRADTFRFNAQPRSERPLTFP